MTKGKLTVNGKVKVVESGKSAGGQITPATVRRLERAGSAESAKIAREYVEK